MKEVTRVMLELYRLKELGYDFMGYEPNGNGIISYHHLIIPKRHGGKATIQNGALIYRVPHDYLHTIERYDLDMFGTISSEMVDMNIKGYLDMENIEYIDDVLCCFEREYSGKTTRKGHEIIKPEYTRRLVRKR